MSVRTYESLDIPELSTLEASCSQPTAEKLMERTMHPFQVIHSKYSEVRVTLFRPKIKIVLFPASGRTLSFGP